MAHPAWWWTDGRCGFKTGLMDALWKAEEARDEHLKNCWPRYARAVWERNISTSLIPDFDA